MTWPVQWCVSRASATARGLCLALLAASLANAQQLPELNEDDFTVSYSYAALMGTGTYKIDGRRITMLRIPVAFTQRAMTQEKFGIKWYMPITIGYDQVNDNSWLEKVFDEELVTLTAMPGFEAQLAIDDIWTLKPYGKIGATYDFTRDEAIILGVTRLRTRGTWVYEGGSELRWGGGLQLAGEYQMETNNSQGFSIIETGIDYRHDTGFRVLERKINAGIYYHFQHFMPIWDIAETPTHKSEIDDLHEIGISVGLKRPRKLFGVNIERVRLGYKRGSGFEGWTLGTDFPI